MFALFVCALLIFYAREFPAKSETREPRKIIVEYTTYESLGHILGEERQLWHNEYNNDYTGVEKVGIT